MREYWSPFDLEGFDEMNEQAMKVLTLQRICEVKDCGTFGVLFDEDVPFCLTVERLWLNNQKGISCIPKGEYICKPVESPKFGHTWQVTEVPGRTEILIHRGNIDDDSHGCVILGENFNPFKDSAVGVGSSGVAFSEFLERLRSEKQVRLVIK